MASYTSHYPPEQNSTYVKDFYDYGAGYYPWYCTDPSMSLIGETNEWIGTTALNRISIDLGEGFIIRRIYFANHHIGGLLTNWGAKEFTFWGSNSATAFADTDPTHDTDWTQLTTDISQWAEHVASNLPDLQYAVVDNTTSYQYYSMKVINNWGSGSNTAVRRIELQTENPPDPTTNYLKKRSGRMRINLKGYSL